MSKISSEIFQAGTSHFHWRGNVIPSLCGELETDGFKSLINQVLLLMVCCREKSHAAASCRTTEQRPNIYYQSTLQAFNKKFS